MLEMLLNEVRNADSDELDINLNRESLLNILYPNYKGKSAFDMCMKRKSPKIAEIYLNMLIELDFIKHYRFSKFIRRHYDALFEMEIRTFFTYLNLVTFRQLDMQRTKKLLWPYKESEVRMQCHSSYLDEDFYGKL
jgi:hypothetical protein